MVAKEDFFISHASADKPDFVQPLANALAERNVTFWLDDYEMNWGDSVALKINDGLRRTRHFVVCLSEAFLDRPWPEAELSAAFSPGDKRKVLPLILNAKERVLQHYPILAGMVFREFSHGVDAIADELQSLAAPTRVPSDSFIVNIESAHTGKLSRLHANRRASIGWLSERARQCAGLKAELDTGGFQKFPIRWVLVDAKAEQAWDALSDSERKNVWAIVKLDHGQHVSKNARDALEDIGVSDEIVFHMHAVAQEILSSSGGGGGGGGGVIDIKRASVCYCFPTDDEMPWKI